MPIVIAAGALDFVMTIGMLILGLLLSYFLVPPLVAILRSIPLIGSQIAGIVQDAFDNQQKAARDWWDTNLGPAVQTIFAPVNAFTDFVSILLHWMSGITGAVMGLAGAAGGTAGGLAARVFQLIATVATQTLTLGTLVTAVGNIWTSITHLLTHTVPDMIGTAVAGLTTLIAASVAAERTARTVAVVAVQQLIAQMVAAAEQLAAQGEAELAHQLAHTAASLAAAIVAAEAAGQAYTDVVAHQLGLSITDLRTVALPAVLTIALTAVGTIATRIDTLERECINPTCGALDAGLSLFQILQQGVELLLVVQLVGLAVSAPDEAARDIAQGADELVGIARPILSAMGIRV